MRFLLMSLILFSTGLFDTIFGANVIPTKEEQANLLTNVEEVFEQVKILVNLEANSTDRSVINDINKMVARASDQLALIEELALTKMSCQSNSVCMLESKPIIQKLKDEGITELQFCINQGTDDITANSFQLTNTTITATEHGQNFLDTLYNCSRKNGLHVISCYKDVIATDVIPVKKMLLGAIEAHKLSHLRTIEIRNFANNCVDEIIVKFQNKMARILNEALHCS